MCHRVTDQMRMESGLSSSSRDAIENLSQTEAVHRADLVAA
jgi:hypothetical protein